MIRLKFLVSAAVAVGLMLPGPGYLPAAEPQTDATVPEEAAPASGEAARAPLRLGMRPLVGKRLGARKPLRKARRLPSPPTRRRTEPRSTCSARKTPNQVKAAATRTFSST